MKFIITGSGGCVSTPKPLCKCNVCKEARDKGYQRIRSTTRLLVNLIFVVLLFFIRKT